MEDKAIPKLGDKSEDAYSKQSLDDLLLDSQSCGNPIQDSKSISAGLLVMSDGPPKDILETEISISMENLMSNQKRGKDSVSL